MIGTFLNKKSIITNMTVRAWITGKLDPLSDIAIREMIEDNGGLSEGLIVSSQVGYSSAPHNSIDLPILIGSSNSLDDYCLSSYTEGPCCILSSKQNLSAPNINYKSKIDLHKQTSKLANIVDGSVAILSGTGFIYAVSQLITDFRIEPLFGALGCSLVLLEITLGRKYDKCDLHK